MGMSEVEQIDDEEFAIAFMILLSKFEFSKARRLLNVKLAQIEEEARRAANE